MSQNNDVTILDKLLVVNLDVHIWSARKKLMPLDLGQAELPPEELASLGSKRICNPDDLRIFATLKARAVSLLERHGIRFLSGWAIPESCVDDIGQQLADIRDEFNQAKEVFLKGYEQSVQAWIASHPDWQGIIADAIVSEDYVRSRLDFRWQMFRVQAPDEQTTTPDNLVEDLQNLGGTLYAEIAKAATETWVRCYEGRTEVTRKALSPLKSIYDKLMGLTFIEPRVSSIAALIETAFQNIPQRGSIKEGTLLMLQGLVSLLRNPQDLLAHGQKILDGQQKAEDALTEITPLPFNLPNVEDTTDSVLDIPAYNGFTVPPTLDSCGLW